MHQMWRHISRGANAARQQRAMRERGDRPLAVGAGDVQADEAPLRVPERSTQACDVLETELDPERFEGEQAVEQFSVTGEGRPVQRMAVRRPVSLAT